MTPSRDWILQLMREGLDESRRDAGKKRKIARLEALAAAGSGATEGEREAAQAALRRLTA